MIGTLPIAVKKLNIPTSIGTTAAGCIETSHTADTPTCTLPEHDDLGSWFQCNRTKHGRVAFPTLHTQPAHASPETSPRHIAMLH
eukprot:3978252-Ditylum_brightwellii.AAC.2